jgi:hypothetical protein
MSADQNTQKKLEEKESRENQASSRYSIGVVNNPCGNAKCVALDIDPEHFLSEGCASVCWDCWFVSQKIQL